VDRRIGDLLGTLTELGLEENTIILFSSDNGGTPASINAPLRGYKQGILDGGIRVPTIAKWPGVYPAGAVSHQVGILTDFSRTIVEAAGAAKYSVPGRPMDGIDLTPILTGFCAEQKRELGWRRREWSLGRGGYNNVWAEAYIKGDWKYIREFKEAPTFAKSVDDGYPDTGYLELLYNLADDVHEDRNLAHDAPEKLSELRTAFEDWKAHTVDADNHYRIPFPDQYSRP
jgi:arylsulfatase A-like enzyme